MDSGSLRKRRNLIVLCILLTIPLYSNVRQFLQQRAYFVLSDKPYDLPLLSTEAESFHEVIKAQEVSGFFPAVGPPNSVDYLKIQYAIAPDVLRPLAKTEYAVAMLADPAANKMLLDKEHYHVIKAFPDGLALLRVTR